jgi:type IV secretory pathway VirB3-like protein
MKGPVMSLGVSIFLLVVGAILTFAVNVTTSGFNIHVVGIILMIGGAIALLLTVMFWSSFSPRRRRRTMVDSVYDGGDRVIEERRVERDLP